MCLPVAFDIMMNQRATLSSTLSEGSSIIVVLTPLTAIMKDQVIVLK